MIRVALIDDHKVVRIGLKYVLTMDDGMELVGEASDALDILGFLDRTKPDVLLLDVLMPGKSGIDALAEIRAARSNVRVVMLTTSDTEEDVYRALNGGALGYVLKDKDPEDIIRAIRLAADGKTYLPADVQRIYEMRKESASLTPREAEILTYVAKGFSNKEIADLLDIASNTIKIHLSNIFEKLDATGRASAVSTAISRGLIHLALAACATMGAFVASAGDAEDFTPVGNPIFTDAFTADPAPIVVGDTLYVITTQAGFYFGPDLLGHDIWFRGMFLSKEK